MRSALLNKWLIEPTDSTRVQFFRYIFVGGIAFVVDYSVLLLLNKKFGLYYQYASLISFTVSFIVNYFLSMRFVFNRAGDHKDLIAFLITGLIGLALNQVLLLLFTDGLRVDIAIGKPIVTVIVFIFNFAGRRLWIYRKAA
ncbi:MAG: GtrA family protein [Firmicutes bacterium]|nr:GtrA family protein [Bacillota bacterium]